MRRIALGLILAGTVVVAATGCALLKIASPLAASAAVDPGRAYLYGRFRLFAGSDKWTPLALQLTNVATNEYLDLRFKPTGSDVYVVDVPSATYRITHLAILPPDGGVTVRRDRLPLPAPLGMPFSARAGVVHYIGDYVAAVSSDMTGHYVVFTTMTTRWKLYEASFKYEDTTQELKRKYPAFGPIHPVPAWPPPESGGRVPGPSIVDALTR